MWPLIGINRPMHRSRGSVPVYARGFRFGSPDQPSGKVSIDFRQLIAVDIGLAGAGLDKVLRNEPADQRSQCGRDGIGKRKSSVQIAHHGAGG